MSWVLFVIQAIPSIIKIIRMIRELTRDLPADSRKHVLMRLNKDLEKARQKRSLGQASVALTNFEKDCKTHANLSRRMDRP